MTYNCENLTIHSQCTIERAVVMPDNLKTGYNGSFPFNLTRTS